MKLTIGFIVICATLYARASIKCPEIVDAIVDTSPEDGILGQVLKMLQTRFDFVDRKLLELQVELKKQREEVGRNISLLQDRSKLHISDCVIPSSTPPQIASTAATTATEPTTTTTPATTTTTTSTTTPPQPKKPASCKEVASNVSGVYLIHVGSNSIPFQVYCEMEKHGGGWLVVQHRFNGSVDFYRTWDQYREGFGDLNGEFWLGLEKMHQITSSRNHELIVEIQDFSGDYGHACYNGFRIGSESEQYSLKTLGAYSGTAGDSMTGTNKGMKFSTKDRENDVSVNDCARNFHGAWWYNGCTYANLNGVYKNAINHKSIHWHSFKNDYHGLSFSRMMIREL
ncbi:fibrinogen-like protein A [Anopheles aquasalis]|uniref:fibrinogen-like protein A n=1 Tax=Anopheles aquasalis TaxID=42839 RepID=UPI00215ADFC7|nr:fibrinogen-like protein A [Anopheles aquasalis]